jgi:hypothetical protein
MRYVAIPISMLQVGQPLPVDIWSDTGQLLLKKGQPIVSEQHRDKLHAFNASATPGDAMAWQRAYERMVHESLREGVDVQTLAGLPMPARIREMDYVVSKPLSGGWSDLQEVLRGILYQGGLAIQPLVRLDGVACTVLKLLDADADDGLFRLFQMLTDNSLGYCATHALLCGSISLLTSDKLGLDPRVRRSLLDAALTQNMAMARDQDSLASHHTRPTVWQRRLIAEHPALAVDILRKLGFEDEDTLDIVRWHHQPGDPQALARNALARSILSTADIFVAKMASRKTRPPLPSITAAKAIVKGIDGAKGVGGDTPNVGAAMATATGFYPPGTFVLLGNGDTAVVAQRSARANAPWVVPVMDKDSMPIIHYTCRDTSDPDWAMAAPLNFQTVRIAVNADKVQRARSRLPKG